MTELTEQQKIQSLYNLIGDRGLYVSTNFDIFTQPPQMIALAIGTGYQIPLIDPGSKAYASPLLFSTLTSLLNHGTMLTMGAPGTGKTTSAEFAGHFFTGTPLDEILRAEILGNPQLKTEDVIATLDTVQMVHDGKKVVLPTAFFKCPVKVWDEVNRTPADLVSSAMKLVDIGQAVYQGELLKSPPGPLYMTANYADEGTFQLTPPFLDRVDVAVMIASPQPWDLKKIRQRGDEKLNGSLDKLLEIPEALKPDFEIIRRQIKEIPEIEEQGVPLVSAFADFLYQSLRFSEAASNDLVRATKGNAWQIGQDKALPGHFPDSPFTYTLNELSVRTAKAMERYAKAYAWFNGKNKVELEDLKTVLPYLLWHKLQPTQKALTEEQKYANDRIAFVKGLVGKVETDYTNLQNDSSFKIYLAVLSAIKNEKLQGEKLRKIVVNAITRIGNTDVPYAINLANHIGTEYNGRINNENDKH